MRTFNSIRAWMLKTPDRSHRGLKVFVLSALMLLPGFCVNSFPQLQHLVPFSVYASKYSNNPHGPFSPAKAVGSYQEKDPQLQPKMIVQVQHAGWVSGVALSPNGKYLATCSFIDGTVGVWDVATASEVYRLRGSPFWAVSFSPDDKFLAVSIEGAETLLIEVSSWKIVNRLGGGKAEYLCCKGSVKFSPDGALLLVAQTGEAVLWDLKTGLEKRRFPADGRVSSVAFSADGHFIALTMDETDTAIVIDLDSNKEVLRIKEGLFFPNSVAFSPDGKMLVIGTDAGARTWDIASGERRQSFSAAFVESAAFFPDGNRILLASKGEDDGSISVWDSATGELSLRFNASPKGYSAFLSRDGCLVAVGGQASSEEHDRSGIARVWGLCGNTSAREKEPMPKRTQPNQPTIDVQLGNESFVSAIAFSPEGDLIATGGAKIVALWETATGRQIRGLMLAGSVKGMYFSGKGRTLLTASEENVNDVDRQTLQLWDCATGEEVKRFSGFDYALKQASLSPDDHSIAAEDEKGIIHLLDIGTEKETRSFGARTPEAERELKGWRPYGKLETSESKAVSPDGRFVAEIEFITDVPTVLLKENLSKQTVRILRSDLGHVHSVLFSPDSKYILGGGNGAALWNVETGEEVSRFEGFSGPIYFAAFGKEQGPTLTAGLHGDQFVTSFWDRSQGAEQRRINQPADGFWIGGVKRFTAALSPNGSSLVTGTVSGDVRLWNAETGMQTRKQGKKPDDLFSLTSVSFSSDGRYVLTSQLKGSRLWDNVSGKLVREFKGQAYVTSAVFSPDGRFVASTSNSKKTVVWLAKTGKPAFLFDKHESWVLCAAFSPNSRYLATGEVDGTVRLWDLATNKLVSTLKDASSSVTSIKFSPDGNYILAGSEDGIAYLWDKRTKIISQQYRGHTASVNAVDFSPHGEFVLTGSEDGTTRFWRTMSATELCKVISFRDETWVAIASDGRFDTNNLETIRGLYWLMPDLPFSPLPIEIFMRDYYEPRLLPRVLKDDKFCELPSLAELNRVQPKVEEISVVPQAGNPDLVTVTAYVSSEVGPCLKDAKHTSCESGVYDLRLYRDGQLVGRTSRSDGDVDNTSCPRSARGEQVQKWRESSVVRTSTSQPVTAAAGRQLVTFTGIRLPQRSDVSQVEFTAYAFNEDRVKSATSKPIVYRLRQTRSSVKRRAYVITVGVDATSHPALRLGFAPNGAREVEGLLRKRLGAEYEFVPVQLISEYREDSNEIQQDQAHKANIQTVLNLLSDKGGTAAQRQAYPMLKVATPDDLVVLYIASHGYADPNGKFYIVPSDIAEPADVSETLLDRCLTNAEQSTSCERGREFLRHGISSDELTQWLQLVDAGQMVLILDSCHSAAVSGPNFKPGPMGDRGFGQLSYDKRMLVLAATQAENLAWGTLDLGDRSLLTAALINQAGQLQKGPFNLREWLRLAQNNVPELYKSFVKAPEAKAKAKSAMPQEPAFFDFSQTQSARH